MDRWGHRGGRADALAVNDDGLEITKEASQQLLRKTTTAFALAGALMLVAGGCGSDEQANANDNGTGNESTEEGAPAAAQQGAATGASDFCQKAKALYDQLSTAAPGSPTSEQVKSVFDKAKALEAPAEIANDWNAILDTLVGPVVNGEIDVNQPAGAQEITQRAAGLAESLQRTGAYFDTTCGFGGAATTIPADPSTPADPATPAPTDVPPPTDETPVTEVPPPTAAPAPAPPAVDAPVVAPQAPQG